MQVYPLTLAGHHVRLEPLSTAHAESLIAAAADGELWNSTVTLVPSRENIGEYIDAALQAQAGGRELPFVIIRKSSDMVVGTTRFYDIERNDRRVAIGYTWLARSAHTRWPMWYGAYDSQRNWTMPHDTCLSALMTSCC